MPWLCAVKEFLKGHRRESLETLLFGLDLGYLETLLLFFLNPKRNNKCYFVP